MNFSLRALVPHLLLFVVNAIYGVNFPIAKAIMPRFIPAFGFIALRVIFGCIMYLMLYLIWLREPVKRDDLLRFGVCGFFGIAANQLLFFKGLSYTSSLHGALIMITTPILTLLLSSILMRQRMYWLRVVGVMMGMLGAGYLIMSSAQGHTDGDIWGDLLVMSNALSYALYLVLVRPLMDRYHPLTIITVCFWMGLPWVLIFGGGELNAIRWDLIPISYYGHIFFVLFGATFMVYLFNSIALRMVTPTTVSSYIFLQPLFALFVTVMVEHDIPQASTILAGGIIFVGLYLIIKPERRF